eukprot:6212599-Pleurochrysis_carterae.AAC.1
MRAAGKLHAALAEALLGTPPALAALMAAGSEVAAESAVADWPELLERVGGGARDGLDARANGVARG